MTALRVKRKQHPSGAAMDEIKRAEVEDAFKGIDLSHLKGEIDRMREKGNMNGLERTCAGLLAKAFSVEAFTAKELDYRYPLFYAKLLVESLLRTPSENTGDSAQLRKLTAIVHNAEQRVFEDWRLAHNIGWIYQVHCILAHLKEKGGSRGRAVKVPEVLESFMASQYLLLADTPRKVPPPRKQGPRGVSNNTFHRRGVLFHASDQLLEYIGVAEKKSRYKIIGGMPKPNLKHRAVKNAIKKVEAAYAQNPHAIREIVSLFREWGARQHRSRTRNGN